MLRLRPREVPGRFDGISSENQFGVKVGAECIKGIPELGEVPLHASTSYCAVAVCVFQMYQESAFHHEPGSLLLVERFSELNIYQTVASIFVSSDHSLSDDLV